MTDVRFDELLAAIARARSRREMLAALTAATMAVPALDDAAAADVHASACLGRNEHCRRKRECCSERCRGRKGKKRRKCKCTDEGERCLQTSDCCNTGVPLLCVSGFCVRDR